MWPLPAIIKPMDLPGRTIPGDGSDDFSGVHHHDPIAQRQNFIQFNTDQQYCASTLFQRDDLRMDEFNRANVDASCGVDQREEPWVRPPFRARSQFSVDCPRKSPVPPALGLAGERRNVRSGAHRSPPSPRALPKHRAPPRLDSPEQRFPVLRTAGPIHADGGLPGHEPIQDVACLQGDTDLFGSIIRSPKRIMPF